MSSQPTRLIVPVAQANLDNFDPVPLAYYLTEAGDTLALLVERFYGVSAKEHPDLLALLSVANGVRAAALLVAGVPLTIPQPGWRALA